MTENRIFELINEMQQVSTNSVNSSKVIPQRAELIAKTLSDLVYKTLDSDKETEKNRRYNVIKLLKTWFGTDSKHTAVSKENYHFIIEHLLNAHSGNLLENPEISKLLNEFLNKSSVDIDLDNEPITEMKNFFKKKLENNREREKFIELIREREKQKLKGDDFSLSIPSPLKAEDCAKCIEVLSEIESMAQCCHHNTSTARNDTRLKMVNAAYALLNLKRTQKDLDLLTYIVEQIGQLEDLTQDEKDLVFYLWKNTDILNLSEDLAMELLLKFSFIYEDTVKKLCNLIVTDEALSDVDAETKFLNDSEMKKILSYAAVNKILKLNIKNLIYEVFAKSKFDKKLHVILKNL
ncbi:uncharacterized protein LOC108739337 [Agrilus planipennis]|uniref:Uncharacterized protein LOC108739337 n=1 Tax=Agrilus planipennis TaxID=224129 RepID=A0A1W4X777_AGRPL|nr:uncharacterized protein LOC108739337 [Agrilus planipennis]